MACSTYLRTSLFMRRFRRFLCRFGSSDGSSFFRHPRPSLLLHHLARSWRQGSSSCLRCFSRRRHVLLFLNKVSMRLRFLL